MHLFFTIYFFLSSSNSKSKKKNKKKIAENLDRKLSLTAEERETIISRSDADDKWSVYTSQKSMITKMTRNPVFELEKKHIDKSYIRNPIAIEGCLPKWALSFRTKKIVRGSKVLEHLHKNKRKTN